MMVLSAVEREVLRQQAKDAQQQKQMVTMTAELALRIVQELDFWNNDEAPASDQPRTRRCYE